MPWNGDGLQLWAFHMQLPQDRDTTYYVELSVFATSPALITELSCHSMDIMLLIPGLSS